MRNQAIRQAALEKGVKHWQIAEALGMHCGTFSRKMRTEFSQEEQEKILAIIDELSKGVR